MTPTSSLHPLNHLPRVLLLLGCFASPALAQLSGFSEPRPMPPRGWAQLDWEPKKRILFGAYAPSEAEIKLISEALPAEQSPPAKPRKLLVYYRCEYPHVSIATAAQAFEMMGSATGVYEAALSDDPAVFSPDRLAPYDAVLLNNTTSFEKALGENGRQALLDFVRSGKGLIGIHSAADSCKQWAEGAELIGGVFAGHPWTSHGTWAFRLESPEHAVNAPFANRGFWLNDEVYHYRGFSPERSRVLISLDMTRGENLGGDGFKQKLAHLVNIENRYPVAWVHRFGEGRVFYSNLGHNPSTYWNPEVLNHYLQGIRFALGDLDADTVASAELSSDDIAPAPESGPAN